MYMQFTNKTFNSALKLNKRLVVLSGFLNPELEKAVLRALPKYNKNLDDFMVCTLKNKQRGIFKSFYMLAQHKFGNVPFFIAEINLKNLRPKITTKIDFSSEFQTSEFEVNAAEMVNTVLKSGSLVSKDDLLEQAMAQYVDLQGTSTFQYIMGFALCALSEKYPKFVENELVRISTSGVVDHVRGGVFVGSHFNDLHVPEFCKSLGWQSLLLEACHPFKHNAHINYLAKQLIRGIQRHIECNSSLIYGKPKTYLFDLQSFHALLKPHFSNLELDVLEMRFGLNLNGNINNEFVDSNKSFEYMNVLTFYKSKSEVAACFGINEAKVDLIVEKGIKILWENAKPECNNGEMNLGHMGLALRALTLFKNPLADSIADIIANKYTECVACDDYAFLISGLLTYGNKDLALKLQHMQNNLFANDNGYFYSPQSNLLFARAQFNTDTLEPNYNAVSKSNLSKLKLKNNKINCFDSIKSPLAHLSWIYTI